MQNKAAYDAARSEANDKAWSSWLDPQAWAASASALAGKAQALAESSTGQAALFAATGGRAGHVDPAGMLQEYGATLTALKDAAVELAHTPVPGPNRDLLTQFEGTVAENAGLGAQRGQEDYQYQLAIASEVATLGASKALTLTGAKGFVHAGGVVEEVVDATPVPGSKARATGARMLTGSDWDAAEEAYEAIRGTDDVASIAVNTGMRPAWVARIKDHLFFRTHQLDEGRARFDADPYIANAWRRMQAGDPAHDAALRSGRTWEWTP